MYRELPSIECTENKELVIDQRKDYLLFKQVMVNDQPVELVSEFKYLGTIVNNKLDFTQNTNFIVKKAIQRLYLVFNVCPEFLETVKL